MLNAVSRGPAARVQGPWVRSTPAVLGFALLAAALVGVLTAVVPPIAVATGLVGLAALALMLARPTLGLFAFAAVVGTLPFGVIPVRLGVQLTFVDAVLIATYVALLVRLPGLLLRPAGAGGLQLGAPGILLLLFVGVAVAAFVAGSAASAELVRRFAKLLAGLLLFLVATNLVRSTATLFGLLRALMAAGALAGAVGTALWLLPHGTQLRLLTALGVVGYPTSNVLRFVPGPNETYTDRLRAIGTAVDPNVFGGTLMLAAAVIGMQWVARERLFSRPVLLLLALPTLSGLLLSYSRAAWVGLAAGLLLVGTLRYRRIWVGVLLGVGLLLALPAGQDVVARFASGLSADDPATALRLGEYRNALTLIQRYPLLGIGFGGSPDIDVTAGVSSVYLLVGEQTGLLGLGLYLGALGAVLLAGLRALRAPLPGDGRGRDERLYGALSSLVAAFGGALVAGVADHYFANHAFPHAVALFWLYAALLVMAARLLTRTASPPASVRCAPP